MRTPGRDKPVGDRKTQGRDITDDQPAPGRRDLGGNTLEHPTSIQGEPFESPDRPIDVFHERGALDHPDIALEAVVLEGDPDQRIVEERPRHRGEEVVTDPGAQPRDRGDDRTGAGGVTETMGRDEPGERARWLQIQLAVDLASTHP